jgi:hypothetical protein
MDAREQAKASKRSRAKAHFGRNADSNSKTYGGRQMNAYAQAIHAQNFGNTHDLILVIDKLLREPIEFSNEYDAEQYVLTNPYGHAKLMRKRIVVSEFFGSEYKK